MRSLPAVIRLLSLLLSLGCIQASDFIDPTFRAGVSPITRGPDGPVYAMAQFPEGRIVIAGDFARVNGLRHHAIARLLVDGSLDTTFDAGQGPDNDITSVVALADGSVLVGGRFGSWGNELAGDHLVRLKPDGSLDHDFAATAAWDGEVVQLVQRPNSTITVLESRPSDTTSRSLLERRRADGTLDDQFAPALPENAALNALCLMPDGGLLVVGRFTEFDGLAATNVVRLKPDDSVDGAFAVPAAAGAGELFSLALANDGRVAIGGSITNQNPRAFLTVLQPDGQPDPQFESASGVVYDPVTKLSFDKAGILLAADRTFVSSGFSFFYRFSLQGTALGTLSFTSADGNASPLALLDGNVLWATDGVYGSSSWLLRTLPDGTTDPAFISAAPPADGFPRAILNLAALPGGDVFADGTSVSGISNGRFFTAETLVHLDSDGSTNPASNAQISAWSGTERINRLLPAGGQKLYLAGGFYAVNGNANFPFLARLNGDGSLDQSFHPGLPLFFSGGFSQSLATIDLLDDGRLYVGGHYAVSSGNNVLLNRLLPDGSSDPTFIPLPATHGILDEAVSVDRLVSLTPDRVLFWGHLEISGGTTELYSYTAAGQKSPGPVVLGPSGLADSSASISQMLRLADGRVLLAGAFSGIGGVSRTNLAILTPDLAVDPGFDVGTGPNSGISTAIQLTDGRILVAGAFTQWNRKEHRRLVLLQPDGRLDETFDAGTGPDDVPFELVEQPDGSVLIAGRFTNLDGRGPARLARLVISSSVPPVPAHLTLQPLTTVSTNLTVPVVLRAAAQGTPPLHYQWFRDGVALTEGSGYSGVSTPQLLIQGTNLIVPASYQMKAANDSGRELSAAAVAGFASGTMDFSFTTNATGALRVHGNQATFVTGLTADRGPDGRARRVLITGTFTTYEQFSTPGLAMVHPDGSFDPQWTPPPGVSGADTLAAAFLPDGRLILAGKFGRSRGAPRDVVLRLNADGTLDNTFDPGDALAVKPPKNFAMLSSASALALDGDGLFVASPFGIFRRLNQDGTTDASFQTTNLTCLGTLSALAVDTSDTGGLLVGGTPFAAMQTRGSKTVYQGVARFLRNGLLDTNYNAHPKNPASGAYGSTGTLLPTADGGAFVAGDFTQFNGAPGPVTHLDALGEADTNFVAHLPGNGLQPYAGRKLLGMTPLPEGNFLMNYQPQTGLTDSILRMQPDGTLIPNSHGPVEDCRLSGPVLQLGDGSYLVPISFRSPVPGQSGFTMGRFFLTPLARLPATNLPPAILQAPSDVTLTNRPAYREPLVLSAVVQAGGSPQVQWHRDGVLLPDQTNATLIITDPTPEDSGRYRLDVSNSAGSVFAEADVVIRVAVSSVPPLSVERRMDDPQHVHLHFSPQPATQYRLESTADLNTWQTVTDPAVRVSDSEFAPALSDGAVFFRLVPEP